MLYATIDFSLEARSHISPPPLWFPHIHTSYERKTAHHAGSIFFSQVSFSLEHFTKPH